MTLASSRLDTILWCTVILDALERQRAERARRGLKW